MKRFLAFILITALLLSMSGCQWLQLLDVMISNLPSATEPTIAPTTAAPPPAPPPPPPEPKDTAFVRIAEYIPSVKQALAYATPNNFTGQRIYDFSEAYLRYGTLKKLIPVCEELAQQGLGLVIWDAFRPVTAQAMLWESWPDPTYVSHPVTGKRVHSRGNTLDVTLYDLTTGEELPMPTGFDDFTAAADRDYSDCPPEAAANALLLEQAMERHGFTPYTAEWWHFSDTKDYPVEEAFYPAVPAIWSANCNEYLNLRSTPGGRILAKIPKGGTMELVKWVDKYAVVRYENQTGYVVSNYIQPEANYLSENLDTVKVTNVYTYQQMLADIETLKNQYPDTITVESIGSSALGRELPVLRIGNPDARYHVLLHGAIHAREHLTTWLLMSMVDYWMDHDLFSYGDVCYHIIPMVNPDGVIISQTGTLTEEQNQIYLNDRRSGRTSESKSRYTSRWKANGQGIDLNGNFPSGWGLSKHPNTPSSHQYPGTAPFTAPESIALRDYTLRYHFDVTISYHATGSLIYYEYGNKQAVNAQSKKLAQSVAQVSGYTLMGSAGANGGGYKDWAIDALEIPSLTIEIGCEEAPLTQREIYSVFARNYRVLPAIARWLQLQ